MWGYRSYSNHTKYSCNRRFDRVLLIQLTSTTSNTLAATVRISTAEPLRVDVIPAPLLWTGIMYSHVWGLPQTYFHNTRAHTHTHTHTHTQSPVTNIQPWGSPGQTSSTAYGQRASSCPTKDFTLPTRIKGTLRCINCLMIAHHEMNSLSSNEGF